MYLPEVSQYSTKNKRVLLTSYFLIRYYFSKHRLSELDIPIVDVYYEFTKSSGKQKFLEYYHKDIATKIAQQFYIFFTERKDVWQKDV